MTELHDGLCICIGTTFAQVGAIPDMTAQQAREQARQLTWTTICPPIARGLPGSLERQRLHDGAVTLRQGQAVTLCGRRYTATLHGTRTLSIILVPHDPDEVGARP